eukprot:12186682-Heterocapsa_arctica.AAC.1
MSAVQLDDANARPRPALWQYRPKHPSYLYMGRERTRQRTKVLHVSCQRDSGGAPPGAAEEEVTTPCLQLQRL